MSARVRLHILLKIGICYQELSDITFVRHYAITTIIRSVSRPDSCVPMCASNFTTSLVINLHYYSAVTPDAIITEFC